MALLCDEDWKIPPRAIFVYLPPSVKATRRGHISDVVTTQTHSKYSRCPDPITQKHTRMPEALMSEQTCRKDNAQRVWTRLDSRAGFWDWRAIRPHTKWPFKVECIYRETGRGANTLRASDTGFSLVTTSRERITD